VTRFLRGRGKTVLESEYCFIRMLKQSSFMMGTKYALLCQIFTTLIFMCWSGTAERVTSEKL
jgi:hypothetical protein